MTDNILDHSLKLQNLLQNLHLATPRRTVRPVFDQESEAQEFVERLYLEGHRNLYIRPIWRLDYEDLQNSSIQAWSVGGKLS